MGSNLEDPIKQVNLAIERLANISQIRLIKSSSLYQTSPWGKTDQADFINAVVKISTALTAHELLFQLREIEKKQGKNCDVGCINDGLSPDAKSGAMPA